MLHDGVSAFRDATTIRRHPRVSRRRSTVSPPGTIPPPRLHNRTDRRPRRTFRNVPVRNRRRRAVAHNLPYRDEGTKRRPVRSTTSSPEEVELSVLKTLPLALAMATAAACGPGIRGTSTFPESSRGHLDPQAAASLAQLRARTAAHLARSARARAARAESAARSARARARRLRSGPGGATARLRAASAERAARSARSRAARAERRARSARARAARARRAARDRAQRGAPPNDPRATRRT